MYAYYIHVYYVSYYVAIPELSANEKFSFT